MRELNFDFDQLRLACDRINDPDYFSLAIESLWSLLLATDEPVKSAVFSEYRKIIDEIVSTGCELREDAIWARFFIVMNSAYHALSIDSEK